jgi:hypothetical protein
MASKYVTLVSSEKFEFVVLREAVMISPMVKSMLDMRGGKASVLHLLLPACIQLILVGAGFEEARSGRCEFGDISYAPAASPCFIHAPDHLPTVMNHIFRYVLADRPTSPLV